MTDEGLDLTSIVVDELIEDLEGANRRRRQEAAHTLALVAHDHVDELLSHREILIEVLDRPEAQTRWEVLAVLTEIALEHAELVSEAYDGAEASLFDEDSAIVRLAAFRFLVRLGTSSPSYSDLVWPLLNEAIQCYHGDPEYRDMLLALVEFANGNLSEETRDALIGRVSFDAENGHGYIQVLSTEIVDIVDHDEI